MVFYPPLKFPPINLYSLPYQKEIEVREREKGKVCKTRVVWNCPSSEEIDTFYLKVSKDR